MKFLLALFFGVFISVQTVDLQKTREAYKLAAQDANKVNAFFNDLQGVTKKNRNELVAYKGASIALMAKSAKTIKEKKEGFMEGVNLVEYAVEKDTSNIEVRFIRLSIQQNVPKILKYNQEIESDKAFVIKHYNEIKSSHLKMHIGDYISNSKKFSDADKAALGL
ncbi:hypothetical protein [Pseudotamlana agarivorans]|uniref:hypothetical protein n=1 Tax=Pseudotamlana agarivorans TaxID=481183 RepID=UPI00082FFEEB|nr:hypothetical protein [Tamlana agarivorans]